MEGDFSIIQNLCEKWPDAAGVPDCLGRLPLHIAASRGASLETVKLLVSLYRNSIKVADDAGNLPLHSAAAGSAIWEVAEYLINENPGAMLKPNGQGNAPLHLACMSQFCSENFAKNFVRKNPDCASQENAKGEIPLLLSCRYGGPLPMVESMTHLKKLLMRKDPSGNTALHLECKRQNFRFHVIQQIITMNDSILQLQNKDGRVPLHELCLVQGPEVNDEAEFGGRVQASIELMTCAHETALRTPDKDRRLPLHLACTVRFPHFVVINSLVTKYRDALELRDCNGCLPLHLAAMRPKLSATVARLLFPLSPTGTETAPTNTEKETPKMRNPAGGQETERTTSTSLVSSGSKFRLPNNDNPLHLAYRHGLRSEVIAALEQGFMRLGVPVHDQRNDEGLVPSEARMFWSRRAAV